MGVTSGFYNSLNGDRTYDAEQMGSLFGGIITDGVFANYPSVGEQFIVSKDSASGHMYIKIGSGRAWFHNIWINNDASYSVKLEDPSLVYKRADSLFFKIDKTISGRAGGIVLVTGEYPDDPSEDPIPPTKTNTDKVFWHRLADIYIDAGAASESSIQTIDYKVGEIDETPIITAPLEHVSAEAVLQGWKNEVDQVVESEVSQFLNNQNSVLSTLIRVTPAIWLCDIDIPEVEGVSMSLSRPMPYSPYPCNFYPNFATDYTVRNRNLPKVGDIMMGKNGFYATVSYMQNSILATDIFCWNMTVVGTGKNIACKNTGGAKNFLITFSGIDPYDDTPRALTSPDVSCDRTFPEIATAYNDGYTLITRILLESRHEHGTPSDIDEYAYVPVELIFGDGNITGIRVHTINFWGQTYGVDMISYSYGYGDELIGTYSNIYFEDMSLVTSSVPRSASYDSNTGAIGFSNSIGQVLFTCQLPVYSGETET